MEWWQAIVLGLVEGLTEYLPVSSTGHVILAQRAMGIEHDPAANAYAICIQAGAILAVLGLYRRRVKQVARGSLGAMGLIREDAEGVRLGRNIIAAFIPAAIIGLLLDRWIEETLFGLWPIVAAWFVGGVAILLTAWWRKRQMSEAVVGVALDAMTWRMALIVGLIQCFAMWPGVSRSLVTIVGGVLVGLSLVAAVEFSFLLGVLTLLAATVYKAQTAGPEMYREYGVWPMVIGSVAAWLSAVVAVRWMVAYLKRHGLRVFGYYRIALAVVVACLIWMGVMSGGQPGAKATGVPIPSTHPAPVGTADEPAAAPAPEPARVTP